MKLILITLLFSVFQVLYAQNTFTVIILDGQTKLPIKDVIIKTNDSTKSFVSNSKGKTKIVISNENLQKNIYCLHFDYPQIKITPSQLIAGQDNIIYLNNLPSFTHNDFTKINDLATQDFALQELVKHAVDKFRQVMPQRKHQYKAFLRQTYRENEKYAYLLEATLTIEDESYWSNPSTAKVYLHHLRESQNFLEIDSLSTVFRYIQKQKAQQENIFYKTYKQNYLRLISDPYTVFASGDSFIWGKTFYLEETYTNQEGDTLYKIEFQGKPLVDNSYIIINQSDQAIVEFSRNQYNQGQLLNKIKVKLKKETDNSYYPYLIEWEEPIFYQNLGVSQNSIIQLFLYKVNFGEERLKNTEVLPTTGKIDEDRFKVNSEIWQSFFAEHPELVLPEEIYQQLSEKIPLEQQFK